MATVSFADRPVAKPVAAAGTGGGGAALATMCGTCAVKFTTVEELRKHYSSEWHSTNVRLRVEGKRRLTQSEFRQQNGGAADDGEVGAGGQATFYSCSICNRHFKSIQTLQSHVRSTEHLLQKEKRILARDSEAASALTSTSLGSAAIGLHRRAKAHKSAAKKFVDPSEQEAIKRREKLGHIPTAEDRDADVDETRCIFCGYKSADVDGNLAHMKAYHAFQLPLAHRVKDRVGLLSYLARKVNGLLCLVCNDTTKMFPSLEALRAHMHAKQHEYLHLTSEYNEFYDGNLDDGEAVEKVDDEPSDKLVLAPSGEKKVIRRRDDAAPVPRHVEPVAQVEQRRMIAAQAHEAQAVILRERREMEHKSQVQEFKNIQHQHRRRQHFNLATGLRANKLHPKGFDGEGEFN